MYFNIMVVKKILHVDKMFICNKMTKSSIKTVLISNLVLPFIFSIVCAASCSCRIRRLFLTFCLSYHYLDLLIHFLILRTMQVGAKNPKLLFRIGM